MKTSIAMGFVAAALLPLASHAAEYATVISATPVMASVQVPRQVCSEEQRFVQPQPSGAGAVIGAIAGGKKGAAIGTAVGGGAGGGAVLATKGKEVSLGSGATVRTTFDAPVRINARM
jgi:uncharacterized protein YcfJ